MRSSAGITRCCATGCRRAVCHTCVFTATSIRRQLPRSTPSSTRWWPLPRGCRRHGMADKQLEATMAALSFQKQWFADLRRRVFDERQPYALVQADVPFELFDLVDVPALSLIHISEPTRQAEISYAV